MWGWEVLQEGPGGCAGGCGLLGAAGRWLCSAHGRFGLEIAEKPSDGEERGRTTRRLPEAAAPAQFLIPLPLGLGAAGHRVVGGSRERPSTYCPAMASAPTVLLCCWLAGHGGARGQRELPKPLAGGSPSWVVAPGENVTIRCEGWHSGVEFLLHKAGHLNLQLLVVPAGTVAEFPLPSVGRADAGSYTCEYRPATEPNRWSHLSDPVEIIVEEPTDPKPSISLRPSEGVSLGASVSVRCRGPRRGRRFVLKREGGQFLHKDPGGFEAEFPLSSLHREQGGSYSCSYHSTSEPFTVSYPSDPVELVLTDPSLPRPSVSLSPTGVTAPGSDVTIRCQGPGGDVRFFLHQAGDLNRPRHMDPAGDGAEFHIRPVGRQHGGSYSCSYRPRAEPFVSSPPSDPVGLVVAGEIDPTQPGAAPEPERPDFTHGNIARLSLGAGILLTLGLILAEAYCSCPRGEP